LKADPSPDGPRLRLQVHLAYRAHRATNQARTHPAAEGNERRDPVEVLTQELVSPSSVHEYSRCALAAAASDATASRALTEAIIAGGPPPRRRSRGLRCQIRRLGPPPTPPYRSPPRAPGSAIVALHVLNAPSNKGMRSQHQRGPQSSETQCC